MPTKPDTRTDIQRLNDSIRQHQETGRFTKRLGTVIRDISMFMLPFAGSARAARKVIEEKLAERKLTDEEYGIANRFLKKYTTPSSPEDKKEYKKGGPVKRKRNKLRKGGTLLFGMKK